MRLYHKKLDGGEDLFLHISEIEKAIEFGERALLERDAPHTDKSIQELRRQIDWTPATPRTAGLQVISFSLWGNNKY